MQKTVDSYHFISGVTKRMVKTKKNYKPKICLTIEAGNFALINLIKDHNDHGYGTTSFY